MARGRWGWYSLMGSGFLALAGCGGQQADSGSGGGTTAATNASAAKVTRQGTAETDSPAITVRKFLEAVRSGDDAEAARWLTPLARQKTQELHMSIAPPGTENSQFEVGEVEMVEGGAHVASTWSDLDSDGNRHADPIVWLVAKEAEGWRIAGMATTLFEEKLPIVLNFEEPEEMLQKQQFVEAEAMRSSMPNAGKESNVPAERAPQPEIQSAPPQQDRMTENSEPAANAPSTANRNVLRRNVTR